VEGWKQGVENGLARVAALEYSQSGNKCTHPEVTMKTRLAATVFGIASVLPLLAHHSVPAEYDVSKMITIQGVVTKNDGRIRTLAGLRVDCERNLKHKELLEQYETFHRMRRARQLG
jgi:hypothetical protein